MGLEVAAIAGIVAGVGSVVSVVGQVKAAKDRKKAAKREASFQAADAEREATAVELEGEDLKEAQKIGILKSGVLISGSPLEVIQESERRVKEEAESIRRLGARRARETRRRGKEGFTADIIGAIGTGLSGAARLGTFGGKS